MIFEPNKELPNIQPLLGVLSFAVVQEKAGNDEDIFFLKISQISKINY